MDRTKVLLAVAGAALIGGVSAKAWWEFAPARLVALRDTLDVFVGWSEQVPIEAFSRSGRQVFSFLEIEPSTDPLYEARRSSIDCRTAGAREITVTYHALRAPLHVNCLVPVAIYGASSFDLEVGDSSPPVRLRVQVSDGRLLPPSFMYVDDTSIAELRDGRLHARRPGRTRIGVRAGIWSLISVRVTERLANDTLELRPGEFRKWPLPAGRYDIMVRDLSGAPRSFAEFEMSGAGTRCVPARMDRDLIHCLVTDTGVVAVHNKLAAGAPRSPLTYVSIVRTQ